jgi:hypothetical protein
MFDLIVTTGVDEDDVGASKSDPKGAGLSFREALKIASADGVDTAIGFLNGLTVNVTTLLPLVNTNTIIDGSNSTLNFSSVVSSEQCWTIGGATVSIQNLTFTRCMTQPLLISGGTNHQVSNCSFIDNDKAFTTTQSTSGVLVGPDNYFTASLDTAVFAGGPSAIVFDNFFEDVTGGSAIFVGGAGDGSRLIGNLFLRAEVGVSFSATADNIKIWHNTFVSTKTSAIITGQASNIDVRNNILTHSVNFALDAETSDLSALDYNVYFSNGGHCSNCSGGLGANSKIQDPIYANFAGGDYTLGAGSPAINTGVDLMVDRNGSSSGNYNGAPDMGYVESN